MSYSPTRYSNFEPSSAAGANYGSDTAPSMAGSQPIRDYTTYGLNPTGQPFRHDPSTPVGAYHPPFVDAYNPSASAGAQYSSLSAGAYHASMPSAEPYQSSASLVHSEVAGTFHPSTDFRLRDHHVI